MQIYISKDGQQLGPYTLAEAQNLAATGRVSAHDWAFYDGAADWMPLSQVPGFSFRPPHPVPTPSSGSAVPANLNPGIAASPAAPVAGSFPRRPVLVWVICLFHFITVPLSMIYLATAPHRLAPIQQRLLRFQTYIDGAIIHNTDVTKRDRLFSMTYHLQAARGSLSCVTGLPYICLAEAANMGWFVTSIFLFRLRRQAVSLYLGLSIFTFLQLIYAYHGMLYALAAIPSRLAFVLVPTAVAVALVIAVNLYLRKLERKGILH